jgi:hypothetical protein
LTSYNNNATMKSKGIFLWHININVNHLPRMRQIVWQMLAKAMKRG